jgi:hypothetical protein
MSLIASAALPALAATFIVDSTRDLPDAVPGDGFCAAESGECTLRAAVMETNELEGADIVEVPAGTYALTLPESDPSILDPAAGDLVILDHLQIVGDERQTIIDASAIDDRVVTIFGASRGVTDVEFRGVVLTGGTGYGGGGCVRHWGSGSLTVRDSMVTGCETSSFAGGGILFWGNDYYETSVSIIDSEITENLGGHGGGLYVFGVRFEIERSRLTGNTATSPHTYGPGFGGGLAMSNAVATVVDSEIADNQAGRQGGGIWAGGSIVHLDRTSIVNNSVFDQIGELDDHQAVGGGVYLVAQSELELVNSTVSGNSAVNRGGGIFMNSGESLWVAFSTIANNSHGSAEEGAGIACRSVNRDDDTFKASIIDGNLAGGIESNCGCFRPMRSNGFNIDGDGSCLDPVASDLVSVDPMLEELGDYGGVGPTHPLRLESPAVDLVLPDECHLEFDNDRDRRIDEDPVDGIDNDNDLRIDEDPVDVVEMDQRGVARPIGEACDAGAVEGQGEVEDVIDDLIDDIRELIDDGEIPYGRGRGLIAELQVALWFLQFSGGEAIAIVRIELFIIKVEGMMNRAEIDEELGNELLSRANGIIAMLEAAGN